MLHSLHMLASCSVQSLPVWGLPFTHLHTFAANTHAINYVVVVAAVVLLAPPPNPLYSGYVIGLQGRTFTLGLVRADGPPGVALLAHVSIMLGAIAAGLGRAVRTLAYVRCKYTREQLCAQTQAIIVRSQ